jgi:ABC-type multidrug transport system fused ATPase/permease subunit
MTETAGVIGGMSLIACAHQLLVRPGLMSTEVLLGFAVILLRLLPVVNQLYALHGQMLYLGGAANTVVQWLQLPVFPRQPFGNREFTTVVGSIQFQDLCYTYTTGTIALDRASFSVPAGKTVALVGGSGSGKSTIAALLLRLRQPSGGHILIDGQDYWSYSAECWHRLVAVVEQESFLFHDTIANNIAYGYPNATPEAIRRAVRLAHLEDFIECLPNGLDTIVGERGAMLSGGQRQRIAIARALVRDPKILILDEATSALDSISERQVQAALEEARCGRTVLVIAHRFSTIQWADSIVVLEGGRVVEQGSWEDLHRAEGAFQSLLTASQLSVA